MNNKRPHTALRAVPMTLFPTADNLDQVIAAASSELPITDQNQLITVLMTYHNTLLKELNNV